MKQNRFEEKLGALESTAAEVTARLLLLEAAAGESPRSKMRGAIPLLRALATATGLPATQKRGALADLVAKFSDRVSLLEARFLPTLPSPYSSSPQLPESAQPMTPNQAPLEKKLVELSQQARTLQARPRALEAATGKCPQAEVSQIPAATPELLSDVNMTSAVTVLTQKTGTLESLFRELSARVSILEKDPSQSSCVGNIPQGKRQVRFEEQLSDLSRQTSTEEDFWEMEEALASSREADKQTQVAGKLSETSQQASGSEDLAEQFEDRLMLLIAETLSEASQKSCALDGLAEKIEASLKTPQAGSIDVLTPEKKHPEKKRLANAAPLELKDSHAQEILQLREELMRMSSDALRERRLSEDLRKGLELKLKKSGEQALLREQTIKELEAKLAAAEAECQQQSSKHSFSQEQAIKELEAKLVTAAAERRRQLKEHTTSHEQAIKDLEARLAAAEAELEKQSSEFATLHERTIKQLEVKLVAATAHRQRRFSERALVYEQRIKELEAKLTTAAAERQRIKELEAKLTTAAAERQQRVMSRESWHMEALSQKQSVLEHEKKIEALRKDNANLEQVVQEHQKKISLQGLEFEGERRGLLQQVEELERTNMFLEAAHVFAARKVSVGAIGVAQKSTPACF